MPSYSKPFFDDPDSFGVLLDPGKDSFSGDSLVVLSSEVADAAAAAEVAVFRPVTFLGVFLHM